MSKLAAKIPQLVNQAKPVVNANLNRFMHYAKVELAPPHPGEIPQIFRDAGKLIKGAATGRWARVTVREGLVNAIITAEVICWFFVGEIIGKRSLIGYKV
ncbi:ATP synthase subunit g, mitochondrial [Tetranychus urticae]|uniref:ATP synthase subunit g n=2 Tax=Tetranychus TaxID=32263 RepID=T1K4U3_TETUR|nr:ATP synthase subunit g, mitochondrial [Tetranychus urticae]AHZ64883.1 ATP synthase g subunit [Tetranychus cinnabarinus]